MALFKKKNKKVKSSNEEIEQLKLQLKEKMDEYRAIYNKLVEKGETELPEDILDAVTGGMSPIIPTTGTLPPSGGGGGGGGGDETGGRGEG